MRRQLSLLSAVFLLCGLLASPVQARAPRHTSARAAHARHHKPKHTRHTATTTPAAVPTAPQVPSARAPATPSGCPDTGLTPNSGNLNAVRAATLCLVNNVRAEHGLDPLTANDKLASAAQPYARLMVTDDFFSHFAPSGSSPILRILATGYVPSVFRSYGWGENIAWGTADFGTPAAIVQAWVHSPEHLANILNGAFRDTGVGVAPAVPPSLAGGLAGATYVQDFGVVNQ
jgi:uncharacterized protein YkwD